MLEKDVVYRAKATHFGNKSSGLRRGHTLECKGKKVIVCIIHEGTKSMSENQNKSKSWNEQILTLCKRESMFLLNVSMKIWKKLCWHLK